MFLSFTHKNISGDSTTASVHSVTADESDSGPTAANYDAYQHLHTHTRTHTLTNTHSQHGNHTHNVYTNHGYAKQMQMTHFPILKCTNRNEKLCAEETIDWKSFLSFWSPVCLCYIVCSAVESFKSSRLFGFNYTKHVFSQTY